MKVYTIFGIDPIYLLRPDAFYIHKSCLNTSHVLIYPYVSVPPNPLVESLNTSHVLIYRVIQVHPVFMVLLFKYISCSYLSRMGEIKMWKKRRFKYISCSYLSWIRITSIWRSWSLNTSHVLIYRGCMMSKNIRLKFKYISCSYLSRIYPPWQFWMMSLNTSHVLIYPTFLSLSLIQYTPFLL